MSAWTEAACSRLKTSDCWPLTQQGSEWAPPLREMISLGAKAKIAVLTIDLFRQKGWQFYTGDANIRVTWPPSLTHTHTHGHTHTRTPTFPYNNKPHSLGRWYWGNSVLMVYPRSLCFSHWDHSLLKRTAGGAVTVLSESMITVTILSTADTWSRQQLSAPNYTRR